MRRMLLVRLRVETLEDRLPPGDVGFSTSLIGSDLGGDTSSLTAENREFRLHRSLVETGSQQSVTSAAASLRENQAPASDTNQPVRTESPVVNPQQGSAFDAMTPKGASESALSAASSHRALHGRNAANIQPATSHNGASGANNSDMTRHAHTAAPIAQSGSSGAAAQDNTQRAFSLKSGGNIHSQGLTVYPTVRANSPVTCSPNQGLIQSETAIAISGNTIVETYNDFRGFYCQQLGFQITGWAFSLDGGQTFTDGGPLPGRTSLGGDAEMAVAPDGSFYMATLYQPLSAMEVLHGTVNDSGTGIDWVAGPLINNAGGYDKENIAVDPNNGFIYLTYTRFGGPNGIWCTHSEDGGQTWIPAVSVRSGNNPQLQ
ncbi:MAG TPA: sialidase family protein, partial [Gemmataceae bacterium]|nr:sialidase family protein [Gemmataceae bacterium]